MPSSIKIGLYSIFGAMSQVGIPADTAKNSPIRRVMEDFWTYSPGMFIGMVLCYFPCGKWALMEVLTLNLLSRFIITRVVKYDYIRGRRGAVHEEIKEIFTGYNLSLNLYFSIARFLVVGMNIHDIKTKTGAITACIVMALGFAQRSWDGRMKDGPVELLFEEINYGAKIIFGTVRNSCSKPLRMLLAPPKIIICTFVKGFNTMCNRMGAKLTLMRLICTFVVCFLLYYATVDLVSAVEAATVSGTTAVEHEGNKNTKCELLFSKEICECSTLKCYACHLTGYFCGTKSTSSGDMESSNAVVNRTTFSETIKSFAKSTRVVMFLNNMMDRLSRNGYYSHEGKHNVVTEEKEVDEDVNGQKPKHTIVGNEEQVAEVKYFYTEFLMWVGEKCYLYTTDGVEVSRLCNEFLRLAHLPFDRAVTRIGKNIWRNKPTLRKFIRNVQYSLGLIDKDVPSNGKLQLNTEGMIYAEAVRVTRDCQHDWSQCTLGEIANSAGFTIARSTARFVLVSLAWAVMVIAVVAFVLARFEDAAFEREISRRAAIQRERESTSFRATNHSRRTRISAPNILRICMLLLLSMCVSTANAQPSGQFTRVENIARNKDVENEETVGRALTILIKAMAANATANVMIIFFVCLLIFFLLYVLARIYGAKDNNPGSEQLTIGGVQEDASRSYVTPTALQMATGDGATVPAHDETLQSVMRSTLRNCVTISANLPEPFEYSLKKNFGRATILLNGANRNTSHPLADANRMVVRELVLRQITVGDGIVGPDPKFFLFDVPIGVHGCMPLLEAKDEERRGEVESIMVRDTQILMNNYDGTERNDNTVARLPVTRWARGRDMYACYGAQEERVVIGDCCNSDSRLCDIEARTLFFVDSCYDLGLEGVVRTMMMKACNRAVCYMFLPISLLLTDKQRLKMRGYSFEVDASDDLKEKIKYTPLQRYMMYSKNDQFGKGGYIDIKETLLDEWCRNGDNGFFDHEREETCRLRVNYLDLDGEETADGGYNHDYRKVTSFLRYNSVEVVVEAEIDGGVHEDALRVAEEADHRRYSVKVEDGYGMYVKIVICKDCVAVREQDGLNTTVLTAHEFDEFSCVLALGVATELVDNKRLIDMKPHGYVHMDKNLVKSAADIYSKNRVHIKDPARLRSILNTLVNNIFIHNTNKLRSVHTTGVMLAELHNVMMMSISAEEEVERTLAAPISNDILNDARPHFTMVRVIRKFLSKNYKWFWSLFGYKTWTQLAAPVIKEPLSKIKVNGTLRISASRRNVHDRNLANRLPVYVVDEEVEEQLLDDVAEVRQHFMLQNVDQRARRVQVGGNARVVQLPQNNQGNVNEAGRRNAQREAGADGVRQRRNIARHEPAERQRAERGQGAPGVRDEPAAGHARNRRDRRQQRRGARREAAGEQAQIGAPLQAHVAAARAQAGADAQGRDQEDVLAIAYIPQNEEQHPEEYVVVEELEDDQVRGQAQNDLLAIMDGRLSEEHIPDAQEIEDEIGFDNERDGTCYFRCSALVNLGDASLWADEHERLRGAPPTAGGGRLCAPTNLREIELFAYQQRTQTYIYRVGGAFRVGAEEDEVSLKITIDNGHCFVCDATDNEVQAARHLVLSRDNVNERPIDLQQEIFDTEDIEFKLHTPLLAMQAVVKETSKLGKNFGEAVSKSIKRITRDYNEIRDEYDGTCFTGVAGCGKTQRVLNSFTNSDIFITPSNSHARAVKERMSEEHSRKVMTQHKALLYLSTRPEGSIGVVYIDEFTLYTEATLIALWHACMNINARTCFVGDKRQCWAVDIDKEAKVFGLRESFKGIRNVTNTSRRIPHDVASMLNNMNYNVRTTSNVRRSIDQKHVVISMQDVVPNQYDVMIVPSRWDKDVIVKAYSIDPNNVKTAFEAQGSEYGRVFALLTKHGKMNTQMLSVIVVMLTRHNRRLIFGCYEDERKSIVNAFHNQIKICATIKTDNIRRNIVYPSNGSLLRDKAPEYKIVSTESTTAYNSIGALIKPEGLHTFAVIQTEMGALRNLDERKVFVRSLSPWYFQAENVGGHLPTAPKGARNITDSARYLGKMNLQALGDILLRYNKILGGYPLVGATSDMYLNQNFVYDMSKMRFHGRINYINMISNCKVGTKEKVHRLLPYSFGIPYRSSSLTDTFRSITERYFGKVRSNPDKIALAKYIFNRGCKVLNIDKITIPHVKDEEYDEATDRVVEGLKTKIGYSDLNDFVTGRDVGKIKYNMKTQIKSTLGKDAFKVLATKGNQGVLAWTKELNLMYMVVFHILEDRLRSALPWNVAIMNGFEEKRMHNLIKNVHTDGLNYYECDYTNFDATQNDVSMTVERMVYETVFPGIGSLMEVYFDARAKWRADTGFFAWDAQFIKTSGEPATLLGNTIVNMFVMYSAFTFGGQEFALFKGDDSLILARSIRYNEDYERVQEGLPIKFKMEHSERCGYIGHYIFCRYGVFPNIVRLASKVCSREFRGGTDNELMEKTAEYQQSVKDVIDNEYSYETVTECMQANVLYTGCDLHEVQMIFEQLCIFAGGKTRSILDDCYVKTSAIQGPNTKGIKMPWYTDNDQ